MIETSGDLLLLLLYSWTGGVLCLETYFHAVGLDVAPVEPYTVPIQNVFIEYDD